MLRAFLFLLKIIRHISFLILSLIYRKKKPSKIPPMNDSLLMISATTVARKIREREITCYDVVNAYVERIKEVDCFLNAVVDNRYEPAIMEAKIYDEQYAAGKFDAETLEKEKPLYGVPVTIKESCAVKGLSFTGCSLARKGIKATADCAVVRIMRNAGAIPLCVTNIPEMCANISTMNLVYGSTLNPYDIRYTVGGSSGGEAALQGVGASLIGIGSDLLGSIRIPALFTGVFGFKPTANIISKEGHFPCSKDKVLQNMLTLGPITRYMEDIELVMKILTSPSNHNLHLNVPVDLKQLKIYYLQSLEKSCVLMPISPDIAQCVLKAANHFKERGIHAEKLPIDWPSTIVEVALIGILNIKDFPQLLISSDPEVNKEPLIELIRICFGQSQHMISTIFFETIIKNNFFSDSDLLYYTQHGEEIRQNLLNLLGEDGVFIYPTFRCPTNFSKIMLCEFTNCMYCSLFNSFGFPALHVPMGFNDQGLPLGVQIIAAPYQDRLCLAVGKELEKAFGGWTPPPFDAKTNKRD